MLVSALKKIALHISNTVQIYYMQPWPVHILWKIYFTTILPKAYLWRIWIV